MKPRPRDDHSQGVTRVQTEKPYARLSATGHVGTHIQFWECREPWHRGRPAQPYTGHAKWNYGEPSMPFKGIDLQLRRKKRAQYCGVDRPMSEEQVMPALLHHPRTRRQRPQTVGNIFQDGVHARSQSFLDKVIF